MYVMIAGVMAANIDQRNERMNLSLPCLPLRPNHPSRTLPHGRAKTETSSIKAEDLSVVPPMQRV